jgi:carbamoyltransferase
MPCSTTRPPRWSSTARPWPPPVADLTADGWEGLRTLYARRAPQFLRSALPGLDPACVRFVPHHIAHAASAHLAAPYPDSSVLVLDGRGEHASHLAGIARGGRLEVPSPSRAASRWCST